MKNNTVLPILILFCFVVLFTCSNIKVENNSIDLVKTSEIIIKLPNFSEYCCDSYYYRSFFPRVMTLIQERYCVLKLSNSIFYWIDLQTKKYKWICDTGLKPGQSFYIPYCVSVSDKNEIVINDMVDKVNIFTKDGDFKESYVLPGWIYHGWIYRKYKNFLITGLNSIHVLDLNTGKGKKIFEYSHEEAKNKNLPGWVHIKALFIEITPEENILIVNPTEPYIYEYSMTGELIHKYTEVPPHYVSYSQIEPYKKGDPVFTEKWDETDPEKIGWTDKWSYSGSPYVYKGEFFIVSRRTFPPVYLDFYSLKHKKYLGSYEIGNKQLVFADDKYIYLYRNTKEKEVVIEKHEVVFNKKVKLKSERPVEKLEIVIEDKGDFEYPGDRYVMNKEYKEVEPLSSIKDFTIKGLDEKEHKLLDFLDTNKKYHILIVIRAMMTCYVSQFKEEVEKFCKTNTDFDYYIILTHPYKDELKRSAKFYKTDEVNPIFNIDVERMLSFYPLSLSKWYPNFTIYLVDNGGNVLHHLESPREDFLIKVLEITKSE